jgi:hypothetical protein
MKTFLTLAIIVVLSTACSSIMVDPNDSTPPNFSVSLVGASSLSAHYTDNDERIEANIDTERHFRVSPRRDAQPVQLLFTAWDANSGISQIRASLEVSFTCHASVLGGTVSKEARTTISDSFFDRAAPGESIPEARVVLVGFSYEDLWQRGNCTRWDAIVDVESGRLTNIQINYSGTAWNNSEPASPGVELNGRFSADDGRVDVGS